MNYRGKEIKINRTALGQGQRHFFSEGNSFFDRVGEALCELNYFPKKEFFESSAFASKAQRFLNRLTKDRPWILLDIAAGHGLTSFFLATYMHEQRIRECWILDPYLPTRHKELERLFQSLVPQVKGRVRRRPQSFADWVDELNRSESLSNEKYIWIGCHACGNLSDAILAMAIKRREPFILMPCCPNRRLQHVWPKGMTPPAPPDLKGINNLGLGLDLLRLGRAQAAAYKTYYREIEKEITPHNRLLLGKAII